MRTAGDCRLARQAIHRGGSHGKRQHQQPRHRAPPGTQQVLHVSSFEGRDSAMRHTSANVADPASRAKYIKSQALTQPSDLQSRWQEVWGAARRADAREPRPARHVRRPGAGGLSPQPPAAPSAWWRPAWVAAAVTLALAAAVAGWWMLGSRAEVARSRLPRGARQPLNLVVITLDTTRADHVGAYGSRDVETPALDRLAREGVLFEQAMTTAPLTLPAHASIFTGRFPPEHGVRDNGGLLPGARADHAGRDAQGPQGSRPAGSSRPTSSTASGESTRVSRPTSTTST